MNKFYELVEGIVSKWAIKDGIISVDWTIGGVTGGSCWDNSPANIPVTASPEPEFEDLDKILAEICPNISFLQYKRLCQAVIKTKEETEDCYYGNYYEKRIKSFSIADLEEYLKDNNLWNENAP